MTWTPYSSALVEELQQRRRAAFRTYKDSLQAARWLRSPYDPLEFLSHYSLLRPRPGFDFWLMEYGCGGDNRTLLFAVPEGLPQDIECKPLHQPLEELLDEDAELRPHLAWQLVLGNPSEDPSCPTALPHFMHAVEGPDTPEARLYASMLTRDGEEIGAWWHCAIWKSHELLTGPPFPGPNVIRDAARLLFETCLSDQPRLAHSAVLAALHNDWSYIDGHGSPPDVTWEDVLDGFTWTRELLLSVASSYLSLDVEGNLPQIPSEVWRVHELPSPAEEWQWNYPMPENWMPHYQGRELCFFTFTRRMPERIVLHRDSYAEGSLCPTRRSVVVATGPGGFIS